MSVGDYDPLLASFRQPVATQAEIEKLESYAHRLARTEPADIIRQIGYRSADGSGLILMSLSLPEDENGESEFSIVLGPDNCDDGTSLIVLYNLNDRVPRLVYDHRTEFGRVMDAAEKLKESDKIEDPTRLVLGFMGNLAFHLALGQSNDAEALSLVRSEIDKPVIQPAIDFIQTETTWAVRAREVNAHNDENDEELAITTYELMGEGPFSYLDESEIPKLCAVLEQPQERMSIYYEHDQSDLLSLEVIGRDSYVSSCDGEIDDDFADEIASFRESLGLDDNNPKSQQVKLLTQKIRETLLNST